MAIDPTDINTITAGTYELVSQQWDQPTSKPGEPFTYKRHRAGARIELDEAEARRLFLAGAVVEPGARERAEVERLRAQIAALEANLPEDVRAQMAQTQPGTAVQGAETGTTVTRPSAAANKDAWVAFAVSKGLTTEEANGMTIPAIAERFPAAPPA